MNFGPAVSRSSHITSKFIVTYTKLFEGLTPSQIAPRESHDQFYSNLFSLDVKKDWLRDELDRIPKDTYLGRLKPFLNDLFAQTLVFARGAQYDDTRRIHALETLSILIRCVLAKNHTGWEVMEVLAGGVGKSDEAFMGLTALANDVLADEQAPGAVRHQVLQTSLTFMCAIGQLSPGAYFLRQDLFPSISAFIRSPSTESFTFEAVLFLAILANFHKSDAARLNPYLKCIKETRDVELLRKVCRATDSALSAATKAYQDVFDDSVKSPTLASTLGSMIASLRPDRALALTTTDPPKELFKSQPIEATVILLPIFEFLRVNPTFSAVLLEHISPETVKTDQTCAIPFTILTLSSYLLTHASSTFSPRSLSYAHLALHILLMLVENNDVMTAFCEPTPVVIPICRQRVPYLSIPRSHQPPVCRVLDCCVLWLRHNLHRRLEVYCYMACLRICYRVVWFLQNARKRLEYEWKELWSAVIGMLNFLATKLDSLDTTGGVEQIVREAIVLLGLCVIKAEVYLPSAEALHEFIYELIRSSTVLRNQVPLLNMLTLPQADSRQTTWTTRSTEALTSVLEIVEFYEQKVNAAGARTAKAAMSVVAKEVDVDGLYVKKPLGDIQVPIRSEDVLGFSRYACVDVLALLP